MIKVDYMIFAQLPYFTHMSGNMLDTERGFH